jgi:hypothetical protein
MTDVRDFDPEPADAADFEARPRRRWPLLALLVVVVLGAGLAVGLVLASGGGATPSGPEGVPLQNVPNLASASTTRSGHPVDGITCRRTMTQTVGYHIHVLVRIYVDGQQKRLPAGAGIAAPRDDMQLSTGLFVDNSYNSCRYWLHVHSYDGIIHIESPVKKTFSLGQFFDVWGQPLSPTQVGPARGTVTAFENGKLFANPRAIPLLSQAVIQLDVGQPVTPFQPETFKVNGLCGGAVQSCSLGST